MCIWPVPFRNQPRQNNRPVSDPLSRSSPAPYCGQAMFEGGGGDQCVTHSQTMRERQVFHSCDGANCDRRRDPQLLGVTQHQTLLPRLQFGTVAHAVKQFKPGNRRDCSRNTLRFLRATTAARRRFHLVNVSPASASPSLQSFARAAVRRSPILLSTRPTHRRARARFGSTRRERRIDSREFAGSNRRHRPVSWHLWPCRRWCHTEWHCRLYAHSTTWRRYRRMPPRL